MSYSSEVLADAPLVYYRLGETTGTAMVDSSGNGRDGTYVNGPTPSTGLLVGDPNGATNFDGTNDYADSPSASWLNVSAYTIEAIIKPDEVTATGLIASRDPDSLPRQFQFLVRLGKLEHVIWTSGSGFTALRVTSATTLTVGNTYHVVATCDGRHSTIYINGVSDGSGTHGSTGTVPAPSTPLEIGARIASGTRSALFDGVIDEVAYYGTVLSPERIAAHYLASITAPPNAGTITATLPRLGASLSGDVHRQGALAATLPALTADLSGESVPLSTEGTLDAALPTLTGAFDGTFTAAPIDGSLVISLPSLAATFAGKSVAPNELEGVLPTLTASLAGTVQVIGRTDLTSDVSEGYNYDGESDVLDDGTTGSIPAGIRLAPIRIVHQSVPAPALVNGRPT